MLVEGKVMVDSGTLSSEGWLQAARAGDLRAIAWWLNHHLMPHGIRALVGSDRSGRLQVMVELYPSEESLQLAGPWRDPLIRYICYQLWQLHSPVIERVCLRARFWGDRQILWQHPVRLRRPQRSVAIAATPLQRKLKRVSRQRRRLRLMRTAMVSGSTAAAFLVGGVIASIKSPVENSNALTSPVVSETERPSEVKAAAETVVVRKHDQVADPSDPNVTMLFSGDVTLSDNYERQYGHDPSYAFAKLDKYRQVDLAMVNLENPLTRSTLRQPGKRFAFKADPKMVDVLKQGGVDIVTLANNHTMDYQEPGLIETLEVLDDAGIMRVGAGRNLDEARRPKIVDVKGQRIAFLGYYGEEYAATATKAGVNTIDETRIAEDIRAIRDQVDWIIVNYHWGQELATHPAEWQRTLARFTIDQGADVIVGHHPHVLQGTELYKGRPIAYSLGNFIFGGNSRSNYDTAILKVAVNERQMKVDLLPIQVRQYQPQIAQGEAGASILKQVQQLSAGFEQPMQASMVLDVQPSTRPGNAARSPMVNPAQPAAPTPTPSTLPEPRVTEPAKPTSEDPTAVPETSPDGGFITAPNHTPFNKSNPDSWNLPKPKQPKWQLRLPFSQPKPEEAGETEPETTDASEADALLPGGLPQAEVSSPAEVTVAATSSSTVTLPVVAPGKIERRTSTTLRPSEASPSQSSAPLGDAIESGVSFEPEISPQDWKQPGKVGAELVPDVSLQGAPQW